MWKLMYIRHDCRIYWLEADHEVNLGSWDIKKEVQCENKVHLFKQLISKSSTEGSSLSIRLFIYLVIPLALYKLEAT